MFDVRTCVVCVCERLYVRDTIEMQRKQKGKRRCCEGDGEVVWRWKKHSEKRRREKMIVILKKQTNLIYVRI